MPAIARIRPFLTGLGAAIVLALLVLIAAQAKGNFDKLTIHDLASGRDIVVNEPGLMGFFAFSDFEDGRRVAPVVSGPGYEITRWGGGGQSDQASVAFDRLRWYDSSSTNTLAHGWIFYEGIVNGSSEYDGLWFVSTRNADGMMEDVLAGRAAGFLPSPGQESIIYVVGGTAAGLLIGGLATFAFVRGRRRGGAKH